MVDYEKEGKYEMERVTLEDRQTKEIDQVEKFIILHRLSEKEAEHHRKDVAQEHENQIKKLNEKYGKEDNE